MSNSHPFKQTHHNIASWYTQHGRHHLPWRERNKPYHVYVSEMMLQQTQVQTVLERFYFPFLERFKSLSDVANASEQDILNQWEGLGYYRRARYLHKAAQQCSGKLPSTLDQLLDLPGIGKNTAHAILCFGYNQAVPILEANVKRIVSRFFAAEFKEPLLWTHAHSLFDCSNSFNFNQALMDIGSSICTPVKPACASCPLSLQCKGKTNPEHYGRPPKKKPIPTRKKHLVAFVNNNNHIILTPRTSEFLGGLYSLNEYDQTPDFIDSATFLGTIKHTYSHFKLEGRVYLYQQDHLKSNSWHPIGNIDSLPLSGADKKALTLVKSALQP